MAKIVECKCALENSALQAYLTGQLNYKFDAKSGFKLACCKVSVPVNFIISSSCVYADIPSTHPQLSLGCILEFDAILCSLGSGHKLTKIFNRINSETVDNLEYFINTHSNQPSDGQL